jgi:hypothetical protein
MCIFVELVSEVEEYDEAKDGLIVKREMGR